ncbi:MAG: hypothetical protein Q3972_00090 [Corynebacterium sp.]|nr:hypothetical protein [Corynebacterium sp.]
MTAPNTSIQIPKISRDYVLLSIPILALWTAAITMNDDTMQGSRLAEWIPLLAAMGLSMDLFALRVGLKWTNQAAPHQYKGSPWRISALWATGAAVFWSAVHLQSTAAPLYWAWILGIIAYLGTLTIRQIMDD